MCRLFSLILLVVCLQVFIISSANTQDALDVHFDFSHALLKQILSNKSDTDPNIVISPFFVQRQLTLLLLAADCLTREEVKSVLKIDDGLEKDVIEFVKSCSNETKNIEKIFYNDELNLRKNFSSLSEQVFGNSPEKISFNNQADETDVETALDLYFDKKTQGFVAGFFKECGSIPDLLLNNASFLFADAVYFQAEWDQPFSLRKSNFLNKYVPFIESIQTVGYAEIPETNTTAIEIPFKNSNLKLVLVKNIMDVELEDWIKEFDFLKLKAEFNETERVFISFPKFTIDNTIFLNEPLEKLGFETLFSDRANLAKAFAYTSFKHTNVPLLYQRVIFDIDEFGSNIVDASRFLGEQAKVGAQYRDAQEAFRANRPFIFILHDDGVIHAAGKVGGFNEVNEAGTASSSLKSKTEGNVPPTVPSTTVAIEETFTTNLPATIKSCVKASTTNLPPTIKPSVKASTLYPSPTLKPIKETSTTKFPPTLKSKFYGSEQRKKLNPEVNIVRRKRPYDFWKKLDSEEFDTTFVRKSPNEISRYPLSVTRRNTITDDSINKGSLPTLVRDSNEFDTTSERESPYKISRYPLSVVRRNPITDDFINRRSLPTLVRDSNEFDTTYVRESPYRIARYPLPVIRRNPFTNNYINEERLPLQIWNKPDSDVFDTTYVRKSPYEISRYPLLGTRRNPFSNDYINEERLQLQMRNKPNFVSYTEKNLENPNSVEDTYSKRLSLRIRNEPSFLVPTKEKRIPVWNYPNTDDFGKESILSRQIWRNPNPDDNINKRKLELWQRNPLILKNPNSYDDPNEIRPSSQISYNPSPASKWISEMWINPNIADYIKERRIANIWKNSNIDEYTNGRSLSASNLKNLNFADNIAEQSVPVAKKNQKNLDDFIDERRVPLQLRSTQNLPVYRWRTPNSAVFSKEPRIADTLKNSKQNPDYFDYFYDPIPIV